MQGVLPTFLLIFPFLFFRTRGDREAALRMDCRDL